MSPDTGGELAYPEASTGGMRRLGGGAGPAPPPARGRSTPARADSAGAGESLRSGRRARRARSEPRRPCGSASSSVKATIDERRVAPASARARPMTVNGRALAGVQRHRVDHDRRAARELTRPRRARCRASPPSAGCTPAAHGGETRLRAAADTRIASDRSRVDRRRRHRCHRRRSWRPWSRPRRSHSPGAPPSIVAPLAARSRRPRPRRSLPSFPPSAAPASSSLAPGVRRRAAPPSTGPVNVADPLTRQQKSTGPRSGDMLASRNVVAFRTGAAARRRRRRLAARDDAPGTSIDASQRRFRLDSVAGRRPRRGWQDQRRRSAAHEQASRTRERARHTELTTEAPPVLSAWSP